VALVEGLALDAPKTKTIQALVAAAGASGSTLFLLAGRNENVERSIRNLERARYIGPDQMNVRDLLRHDTIVIEVDALEQLTSRFGRRTREVADA
jgi:large subunit ribosomal protein L4